MKKSILLMAVLIALVSLCLVFASCDNDSSDSGDPTPPAMYTVTFNMQGHGTAIEELTNVPSGFKITEPTAPTATGYTFGGWYKEAACTNAWNFSTDTVTKNVTLYAKWQPEGPLSGLFTVDSSGTKVRFSKGNLWADGSKVLHFEDAQWKSTPASNGSKDVNHVSHFTWSEDVASAVSNSNSGSNLFCDESHKQSVDGSKAIYYALSKAEWEHLLYIRSDANRFAKANVKEVKGLLIFPDGYTLPSSYSAESGGTGMGKVNTPSSDAPFPTDSIPAETWAAMEEDGVVFLPAAGNRYGSDVSGVGSGLYWSSTPNDSDSSRAYSLQFDSSNVNPAGSSNRFSGQSVRLVCGEN